MHLDGVLIYAGRPLIMWRDVSSSYIFQLFIGLYDSLISSYTSRYITGKAVIDSFLHQISLVYGTNITLLIEIILVKFSHEILIKEKILPVNCNTWLHKFKN